MDGKAILSVITSFLFALTAFFVLHFLEIDKAFLLSIAVGLMTYILLFSFLFIYETIMNRKYSEIEKTFNSPIFFKTNGNFDLGYGKVKNGNIYFCDAGIICICLDEKPYTYDEILLQDIVGYQSDYTHLNIFANDGRLFVITTPDAAKIMDLLHDKEWV